MIETHVQVQIENATRPVDVFGALTGSADEKIAALKKLYRTLAMETHTDYNPTGADAFIKLGRLYDQARREVAADTYGLALEVVVLTSRKYEYGVCLDPIFSGDVADFYAADTEAGPMLVKIARHPTDNTIIEREARTLRFLLAQEHVIKDAAYFPPIVDTFSVRSGSRRRAAIVFSREHPNLVSLEQVQARYPRGIDPKDMAWMFRRVLLALTLTHEAGRVHGAVMPHHILIEPQYHGVVLIDWKHSVEIGSRITTIPKGTKSLYPSEVIDKKPATAAVDIRMAVSAMAFLLGDLKTTTPKPLRSFFNGCVQDSLAMCPQSAWELREEFDDLIVRMWGPRRFHSFSM